MATDLLGIILSFYVFKHSLFAQRIWEVSPEYEIFKNQLQNLKKNKTQVKYRQNWEIWAGGRSMFYKQGIVALKLCHTLDSELPDKQSKKKSYSVIPQRKS